MIDREFIGGGKVCFEKIKNTVITAAALVVILAAFAWAMLAAFDAIDEKVKRDNSARLRGANAGQYTTY